MDHRAQDPNARIRALADVASSFKLDHRIPVHRYFRSGTEMLRMADVYHREGNFENAYILYLKFLTMFVEKIIEHPEYGTVSTCEKTQFSIRLKEVFPKTEALKKNLLARYLQDHQEFITEMKKQQNFIAAGTRDEIQHKCSEEEQKQNEHLNQDNRQAFDDGQKQTPQFTLPKVESPSNVLYPSQALFQANLEPPVKSIPEFDRSLKPRGGPPIQNGLRKVVIPATMISDFVILAYSNTKNNVETCGILAGKLAHNQFWITHLVVPKQSGNADSCTTHNEEELFAVQDHHDLVTLGWIHTHPTQTAFLSSVDLHTQCGYQMMMPEAIAVVCAPKYNETGYFTLTPNYGLETVASCREQGFHPHPSHPPLFQVASHIDVNPLARSTVIDLRKV